MLSDSKWLNTVCSVLFKQALHLLCINHLVSFVPDFWQNPTKGLFVHSILTLNFNNNI